MTGPEQSEVSYAVGGWVALASHESWLLVDLPVQSSIVKAVWPLLRAGDAVDNILDLLVAGGIRAAPSFALLRLGSQERRTLVRGAAAVRIVGSDGSASVLVAAPGTAWGDHVVQDGVIEVLMTGDELAPHDPDGSELPMAVGVMPAAFIRVGTVAGQSPTKPPVTGLAASSGDGVASLQDQSTGSGVSTSNPAPELSRPAVADEADGAPALSLAKMDDGHRIDSPGPVSASDEPAGVQSGGGYDFLFGATQRPEASDLLPPPPVVTEAAARVQDSATRAPHGESTLSPEETRSHRESTFAPAETNEIIDSLPWAMSGESTADVDATATSNPGAALAPPAVPLLERPSGEVPHDVSAVHTVNRAQLLAEAAAATAAGPVVLAVHCPSGHLTSAHSAACRVCRAPIAEQVGFETARPKLGVLRLSDTDTVPLDRGVVLGRAPEAPSSDDHDRPHLVRLTSPENDVSRSHAEVVLDGWTVYVRDLDSTNGTFVTLPGQSAVRLRPGDLFPIEPNTVVNLADEIFMTFEVVA